MTILAVKYNNPGNISLPITGWTGGGTIVGAPGQSGYASFPTMAIGYAAFKFRLAAFIKSGRNTIASIGAVYAADLNWPLAIARISGIGMSATLDLNNVAQISALEGAIIKQETGMTYAELGIIPTTVPAPATPSNGNKNMNISLLSIIFKLLPLLPMLEANIELEVKELNSTDDGATKLSQTIAVLEDTIAKIKAAIA